MYPKFVSQVISRINDLGNPNISRSELDYIELPENPTKQEVELCESVNNLILREKQWRSNPADPCIEELEANLAKYRLLTESVSDVIWEFDVQSNKFIYISPSVFELRGITVEEAMNEKPEDMMTPESWQNVMGKVNKKLNGDSPEENSKQELKFEIQQYRKDRSLVWLEIVIKFITDENNNLAYLFGVSRNIEERKRAEGKMTDYSKELESLNNTKDHFFSIIAHELRGPLGSIDAFLEQIIICFDKIEKENLLPDIKQIKETSQSTFELLERLLVWARSQKSEIAYQPKPHNLSRLINSNISLFSIAISDKELDVRNEIPEDTYAFFDYDMIKTVVRNLLNNAIKFSNIGGKIDISAQKTVNDMLEISVCDNGIGMDKETSENLFRLDVKQKSRNGTKGEKGSGLGLILCKDFIERHNGEIWFESEVGKGSCAIFTIPIKNN